MADAVNILKAVTVSEIFIIQLKLILQDSISYFDVPVSVIVISFLLNVFFLISIRMAFKALFYDYLKSSGKQIKNVMIYGVGQSALNTKNSLSQVNGIDTSYNVRGFIDDNRSKIGKSIEGIGVFSFSQLKSKSHLSKNLDEIIISNSNLSTSKKNEIIDFCLENEIAVKTIPPLSDWVGGKFNYRQIRNFQIEDLLGRDSIKLDKENIRKEIEGKVVLITGAAGSIGSEISKQVISYNPNKLILLDQSETGLFDLRSMIGHKVADIVIADVCDQKHIDQIFEKYRPQMVFHTAAYKHVPLMEDNPDAAITCNIQGTKTVADCAVNYDVEKFVFVSTDKAVNPTGVMGASKRIAEMYVQSLNQSRRNFKFKYPKFVTTRFGNVLGSSGSVIPVFQKQIQKGGPLTVTHPEITRYFMTIPEACQLVLEAGVMGDGGEIYIFDMGESVKIIDMAEKMIKLSGFEPYKEIDIEFTGLRQGEKLYEELLNTEENTKPTHHPKIMIANVREVMYDDVNFAINNLISHVRDNDKMALVKEMKNLVPEFKSNASEFVVLDRK